MTHQRNLQHSRHHRSEGGTESRSKQHPRHREYLCRFRLRDEISISHSSHGNERPPEPAEQAPHKRLRCVTLTSKCEILTEVIHYTGDADEQKHQYDERFEGRHCTEKSLPTLLSWKNVERQPRTLYERNKGEMFDGFGFEVTLYRDDEVNCVHVGYVHHFILCVEL